MPWKHILELLKLYSLSVIQTRPFQSNLTIHPEQQT